MQVARFRAKTKSECEKPYTGITLVEYSTVPKFHQLHAILSGVKPIHECANMAVSRNMRDTQRGIGVTGTARLTVYLLNGLAKSKEWRGAAFEWCGTVMNHCQS
ncbi:hypothetical protein AVEN_213405-1 [Araneus ventricosus]|uniref:Uncharacterized protein n=1 Tax=Araneus ventricosus TaxID=182803 RepID=A0A4Y2I1M4_ARAVE|nr:hypothetical protein AVEN_229299-1 [Araneus ventricosus]GBM71349.1 hypothetical protein AVEN_20251-1 [Araneus ventricosus]GBM71458.1 hypothetical protein AVEN_138960-1 [Araneus ventricosus]GBM71526.1 hypothetical protein AVEN_213405-1 [Araneus ventricosus]